MKRDLKKRFVTGLAAFAMLLAQLAMPAQLAFATDKVVYSTPTNGQITICHRTKSVTNPYEQITISVEAADGLSDNNGNGANADHYGEHKGLVFNVNADPDVAYPTPRNGDQWGDIIPPVIPNSSLLGANTVGLNWNEAGMAIYYNDCNVPVPVKDAAADVMVTGPTCDMDGSAITSDVANATLTGTLDQSVGTHTATFTANEGHLFADGSSTLAVEYTISAQLTGEQCEEPQPLEIPLPAGIADICGPANDTVPMPAEGNNYVVLTDSGWVQGDESAIKTTRTITYETTAGYVFTPSEGWVLSEDKTQATYTFTDFGTKCPSENICTVTDNTFDSPWMYGGYANPDAGADTDTYPTGTISGTYNFEPTGLYLSTPAVESYVSGLMDAGNTPIADVDAMSYDALRLPRSAGYASTLPAYILMVDTNGLSVAGGLKYFFYEPYNNDSDRAAVEGVFQTWDALDDGDAAWWISGTGQALHSWDYFVNEFPAAVVLAYGFNQGTSNQETFSAVQDITFDCATTSFTNENEGGNGGGGEVPEEPVTPVVPTPTVPGTPVVPATPVGGKGAQLPEELPMTGSNGSILSTWVTLLAAILTYGAVFYLQPKKQFEQ